MARGGGADRLFGPERVRRSRGGRGAARPAAAGARGRRRRRRVPIRRARRQQDLRSEPVERREREPRPRAPLHPPWRRARHRGQRGQPLDHRHLRARRRPGGQLSLRRRSVAGAPQQRRADRPRPSLCVPVVQRWRGRWQRGRGRPRDRPRRQRRQLQEPHHRALGARRGGAVRERGRRRRERRRGLRRERFGRERFGRERLGREPAGLGQQLHARPVRRRSAVHARPVRSRRLRARTGCRRYRVRWFVLHRARGVRGRSMRRRPATDRPEPGPVHVLGVRRRERRLHAPPAPRRHALSRRYGLRRQ